MQSRVAIQISQLVHGIGDRGNERRENDHGRYDHHNVEQSLNLILRRNLHEVQTQTALHMLRQNAQGSPGEAPWKQNQQGTSIEAGVNWVSDQCSAVKYLPKIMSWLPRTALQRGMKTRQVADKPSWKPEYPSRLEAAMCPVFPAA